MAFEFDPATAKPEGFDFDPSTATLAKPAGAIRRLADTGLSLAKGVIGVPEAAVGVADLVTGGRAGKAVEAAGVRLKEAKDILSEQYSPEQKAANAAVSDAKGFIPTLGAMVQNPSTVVNAVAESAPSMLGGGVVSRGALKLAPAMSPIAAGALGEGVVSAGQNAEQVRQEDPNGILTPQQSAVLAASGALTGGISLASGKLANRLGIGDVQTMLASGKVGTVGEQAAVTGAGKGAIRKLAEGFTTEGAMQEMPQSYQEQVAQNIAQGKPWDEGASAAAAQGLLTGGLMGAGGSVAAHLGETRPAETPAAPVIDPGNPVGYGMASAPPVESVVSPVSEMPQTEVVDLQPVQPVPATRSEAMGIDPADGPIQAAASMAVEGGAHDLAMAAQQAQIDAEIAGKAKPVATKDVAKDATNAGTLAPPAQKNVNPQTGEIGSAFDQREADRPQTQPGDIFRLDGTPFDNHLQARRAAREAGDGFAPFKLGERSYVVRKQESTDASTSTPTATRAPAAPDLGTARADAAPAVQPAAGGPVDQVVSTEPTNRALTDVTNPSPQAGSEAEAAPTQTPAAAGSEPAAATGVPGAGSAAVQAVAAPTVETPMEVAAHAAATSPLNDLPEPTQAQKEVGNYPKGHIKLHGLDISIENPRGSTRSGTRPDGTTWSHDMSDHYGYIKRTVGADDEQVDVYVGPKPESTKVFVVDQLDQQTGGFDEHKAMLGYVNQMQAMRAYRSNFDKGWKVGPVKAMTTEEFKTWLKEGDTKSPAAPEKIDKSAIKNVANSNGALPPELAAKLQEAHKAHGRDVTQATVQRAYDRALSEIATGQTSNGGVKSKIKPTAMAELKRRADRLANDLSLFRIQPQEKTSVTQANQAQQAEAQRQKEPTAGPAEPATGAAAPTPAEAGGEGVKPGLARMRAAKAASLGLVKVKTVNGGNTHVKQSDLDGNAPLIRQFTAAGSSNGRIHRENLDPTGEKQAATNAENASNPLFDVITPKSGVPFPTEQAAKNAQKIQRRTETHDVVAASEVKPGATGFVLRKKIERTPAAADPQAFVTAPDGTRDYGEITAEMSKAMRRQAGKIRLQQGNEKFGLAHIEARHGDQIRAMGFKDVSSFVSDALANIESIWKPDSTSQLVVVQSQEKGRAVFIQLQPGKDESGDFYTVNTAFPTGDGYAEKKEGWRSLWSRVPVPANDTGKPSSFAAVADKSGQQRTMESNQSEGTSVAKPAENSKSDAPPPFSGLISDEENAALDVRAKAIDAQLDAMTDDQVRDLYKRANLAGDKRSTSQLLATLKQEHPDDIEPLLEKATPENDRNHFTLQRLNQDTGNMEPVTFARGEYVRHKIGFGEIDGISHANGEFSVDGLWYPFGYAYKADKPEAVKPPTVPLSKVLDAVNKKYGGGLTDADLVPTAANVLDSETSLWSRITDGTATLDEFKAGFENWVSRKDMILEALAKNKKDDLLKMGGSMFAYRNKSETKPEIVEALWRDGASQYVLARSFSHGMGKNAFIDGVRNMVENTDTDQLAQYAKDRKAAQEEAVARVGKVAEAIKDPKSLDDFHTWMRATMSGGKTFKEARLALTPDQRAQFDDLTATDTRSKRKDSKDEQKTRVAVAGQVVDGDIIATKHTKKGHDVFVVQLSERVSREDYDTLNSGAKRIGGYYSSFRGSGAVPGFQFTSRDQAQAFVKLAQGDNADAQAAAQERRDSFEDDRSQTAVERLTEMASRLEDQSNASLSQERKQNTDKRVRQAASAEAAANAGKAMAKTMRNIAQAITDGKAKFLDRLRQKTQVAMLQTFVHAAHYDELRAKELNLEKYKDEPATQETADFAEFPTFTAYRSDLASLARQLSEVDGTKLLGQRLLKVADDVSDAFNKFAKENAGKLMAFRAKDGGLASFGSRDAAERSIAGSGFKGKALPHMVKRGEYTIILSPSEAIERGVWQGDGDKRITLSPEFGADLVEKIGKAARRGSKVSVPWQFESAHDKRKSLARMGIETPAELRAALREFIGLQERAAAPDRVKQMERAMVGRRNDGLDFFPTPGSVVEEMISAAGIEDGMSVLEPSAGMGHIAESIRDAGVDPDVIELSGDRRELLEAKGFNVVASDFTSLSASDLPNGEGYDRILMNPPFSQGRDIVHVKHAYSLLKPGGRIVAIMGESAFTNQNKKAAEFREWLDEVGGTEEKLPEGSFNDPNLPVNTGANARMVVIEKPTGAMFSQGPARNPTTVAALRQAIRQLTGLAGNLPNQLGKVVATTSDEVKSTWEPLIGQKGLLQTEDPKGDALAFFDPKTKTVFLLADRITAGDEVAVLAHELMHKHGQAVLGREGWDRLHQILNTWAAAEPGSQEAAVYAYARNRVEQAGHDLSNQEMFPYAVEAAIKMGIQPNAIARQGTVSKWLAQVKTAMRSAWDKITGRPLTFDTQDLVNLAFGIAQMENPAHASVAEFRGTNDSMTNKDVVGNQGGRSADDTTPGALSPVESVKKAARESFSIYKKRTGVDGDATSFEVDDNDTPVPFRAGAAEQELENLGWDIGDRTAAYASNDASHYITARKLVASDPSYGDEYVTAKIRISNHGNTTKAFDHPDVNIAPGEDIVWDIEEKLNQKITDEGYDLPVIAPSDARLGYAVATEQAQRGKPSDGSGENITTNEPAAPDSGGAPQFSRSLAEAANDIRGMKLPAGYVVNDLVGKTPGKLNWWHKTIGTMYNLAQRSPEFKRVFDSVQGFINDVSFFATEAADLAPKLLPKLETWKDIAKSPVSAADSKAIAAPIFEGTLTWARDISGKPVQVADLVAQAVGLQVDDKAQRLLRAGKISEGVMKMWQGMPIEQFEAAVNGKYERDMLKAGVVWTDAELRDMFKLTPTQIGLYHEFRAATNKSLTNLAVSDMLRFGGDDVAPARAAALDAKTPTEAAEVLRDYLLSVAREDMERSDLLTDTANRMIEKADQANDLMVRGYAPLSRFGQYTVDVVDVGGERTYFGMFESRFEAARMARTMRAEFPGAQVTQGTVSEQAYKMFAGVSPETLELFGDMLGLEGQGDSASSQAFQTYLKLARSNRSAVKRLIERKGIAGFSEDAGRVLAGFVYSNARQTASNLHMGEMTQAAADIDQQQGELKDQAVKLVDYIKNPREEAQALRGLLFAQYIGGSVASALVNMTQPFTMTLPWLSQYGGITGASKQMAAAMKDVGKRRTGDAQLDAALRRAEEDGTVSPQEVHQLMQQAQGRGSLQSGDGTRAGDAMAAAQNGVSRVSLAWGKAFSVAEQFNRRVTFIAAYRTAVAEGMTDPDGFARRAIAETQGVYNKGNKPAWARGAIGATLFTFKQYSISYVEMLSRMAKSGPEGRKAALLALAVLFLMSGAGGLPGADDLDDVISGTLQAMGYNFDSRNKRQEFLVNLLGQGGAQFVEHGISGLPGAPIDVSGRLGMGNLIPGTGLATKKTDHTRDVAEIAGPAGDLIKRAFEGGAKLVTGDVGGGVASVMPKAMQNLAQAYDMANMGMYRDQSGKKVIDTDAGDAVAKAIGFQPSDVKRVQDASIEVQRMIGLNKIRESEIADAWSRGLFERDPAKVEAARNDLKTWNADNPESPIRIKFSQVLQRVKKMNESKAERIAKTAPAEIRAAVRRELTAQ